MPATTGTAIAASTSPTIAANTQARRERPCATRAVRSAPQFSQRRPPLRWTAPQAGQRRSRGASAATTSSRAAPRASIQGSCRSFGLYAKSIYSSRKWTTT